jgi:redox-sensitive bicupin YhaK (pirin superfamily)
MGDSREAYMLIHRKAQDRGRTDLGWLDSRHTFSFGGYQDPGHMGFRALRVLNDDRIAGGKGFGAHGHRDMEILTYVLRGGMAHRDSTGSEGVLLPNELQVMTAGTGVIHSEFNASATEAARLLQIWIAPTAEDLPPSYQHIRYAPSEKRGRLRLLAGPDRAAGSSAAFIHQDARLYAAVLAAGERITHEMGPEHHSWVQCAEGRLEINGLLLEEGDGVAISREPQVTLAGAGDRGGELLLFDLA